MQARVKGRMMTVQTELGQIEISNTAVASLAAHAVLQSYGVVGMALPSLREGIAELLQRDSSRRGVVVTADEDEIAIDLYVVLEYGLRISEVAHNITNNVKFAVEQALGHSVKQVNVHVQGLRVS